MTRATVRWPSTWSKPSCGSSSTTKMHVCGQNLLRHTARAVLVIVVEVSPGRALGGVRLFRDEFAVDAQGLLVGEGVVPEKAAGRERQRVAAVVGIAAREAAERLLQVVGDVGRVRP